MVSSSSPDYIVPIIPAGCFLAARMAVLLLANHVHARAYLRFGLLWVDVATAVESVHDDVENLFDALETFLPLFDAL